MHSITATAGFMIFDFGHLTMSFYTESSPKIDIGATKGNFKTLSF